jgi:hypothetical protein
MKNNLNTILYIVLGLAIIAVIYYLVKASADKKKKLQMQMQAGAASAPSAAPQPEVTAANSGSSSTPTPKSGTINKFNTPPEVYNFAKNLTLDNIFKNKRRQSTKLIQYILNKEAKPPLIGTKVDGFYGSSTKKLLDAVLQKKDWQSMTLKQFVDTFTGAMGNNNAYVAQIPAETIKY